MQILLDPERYERLQAEAAASGRSVAAVVREAIDLRFTSDAMRRSGAAVRLLGSSAVTKGTEPDWGETKAALANDLEQHLG